MTILLMALLGVVAGFALDAVIARLAREPFERARGEREETAEADRSGAATASLDLSSEAGTLALPAALQSGSSARRAIIVAATGGLFAAAGARHGDEPWELAVVSLYLCPLIICAATDIIAYRVPNVVSYPAILGALIIGMVAPDANRLDVIAGGLVAGGPLLVMSVLTGGAMGLGDVKLALFVGLAVGIGLIVPAMLVMALSGGIVAMALMVRSRWQGRRDTMPYAPYIALGAAFVLLTQGPAIG